MKNLILLTIIILFKSLQINAQDAILSTDSLEMLEKIIKEETSKINEKPTRIIGASNSVYAGKAIQTYQAKNMIAVDLITLFKDVNQEVNVHHDKNNNRLILTGAPDEIDFALQQLDILDEQQKMITVEFMLVEYFHDDEFEWGFDIINATSGSIGGARYTPAAREGSIEFDFKSVAKLLPEFQFNLQALVNEDKAKIVTNPHLAVEAGEKATLNLKDERTIQLETATINGVTTTLQNISAGIELDIEPTMINDNLIKLRMRGFVSEFLPFSASGEFLREANTINTVVDVKPGETFIVGGMIKEEYNNLNGGVPILKDIPVLGYLFKRKKRIKTYIERVMYVTPYINYGNSVEDYQQIREKTQLEKDVSEMIERDRNFLKYKNTKKAYKKRKGGIFNRN